jgi:hypothetical protein
MGRLLNELRREGYVEKGDGKYTQTAKAAALWKPLLSTR